MTYEGFALNNETWKGDVGATETLARAGAQLAGKADGWGIVLLEITAPA